MSNFTLDTLSRSFLEELESTFRSSDLDGATWVPIAESPNGYPGVEVLLASRKRYVVYREDGYIKIAQCVFDA